MLPLAKCLAGNITGHETVKDMLGTIFLHDLEVEDKVGILVVVFRELSHPGRHKERRTGTEVICLERGHHSRVGSGVHIIEESLVAPLRVIEKAVETSETLVEILCHCALVGSTVIWCHQRMVGNHVHVVVFRIVVTIGIL